MIGYVLLIFAIFLYVSGNKRWSLLIFLSFVSGGFQVLTKDILGVKGGDLAFFYTVVISIYSSLNEKQIVEEDPKVKCYVKYLFIFLIASVGFSYLHYGFTFYQILQGGRMLFLFLSYYFLRKVKLEDAEWLFKALYYITLVTSVLYIIEVLSGLPVLPYGEAKVDNETGIFRYYNSPIYIALFIYATILYPEYFKQFKFRKFAPYIFCLAQLCTLGRTEIAVVAMMVFVGLWMKGQRGRLIWIGILGSLLLLPLSGIIMARFNSGNSGAQSDITAILNGEHIDYAHSGVYAGQGTMTYRFGWIYERVEYLSTRPLGENLFGLGMISDSQSEIVQRMYRFNLGLIDEETGNKQMMSTPDIAYGNFITQFGYLGGSIFLLLWIFSALYLYKNRSLHPIVFLTALTVIGYFIRSMSGSLLSSPAALCMPFLFMSMIPQLKEQQYE